MRTVQTHRLHVATAHFVYNAKSDRHSPVEVDFIVRCRDSVPVVQFNRKNHSFVHSVWYSSFSGESCNAQFSAPRSQTIVLTVNITL